MEVAHEELLEAFEDFEVGFGSGDDFKESQGGVVAGLKCHRVWGEAQAKGAAQTGSSGNPGSTSRPLPPPLLPSTHLRLVYRGARLLLLVLALSIQTARHPSTSTATLSRCVPQENCVPAEPPTSAKKALPSPNRQPSKEPGGRKLTRATSHRVDPCSRRQPKESCVPAEPPSSTTKAMMTVPNGQPAERPQEPRGRRPTGATRQRIDPSGRSTKSVTGQSTESAYWRSTGVTENNIDSA